MTAESLSRRRVWLPMLELMIPPDPDGLRILELDTDPDSGHTSARLAQRGGP